MSTLTETEIHNALRTVKYPGYTRDIVSFGLVKEVAAKNGAISVTLQLTGGSPEVAQQIKTESERVLRALPAVQQVYIELKHQGALATTASQSPWAQQNK